MPGSSVHGILRHEYWSGLSFPPRGDLPNPGLNPHLLHWQADSLPLSHQGSPDDGDGEDEDADEVHRD